MNWQTVAGRGPDSDRACAVSPAGACSLTVVTKPLGDLNQSQAVKFLHPVGVIRKPTPTSDISDCKQ